MDDQTQVLDMRSTALALREEHALPSIADIKQRMTWMTEFRQLLIQYVRDNMDPTRHMYTFGDRGYERIQSFEQVEQMLDKGQKPALNQDGVHNIMALYMADIVDQDVQEWREDDHYTCRVTLRLRYFGSRTAIGQGSCTTRETKYAYRWVYDNDVPKGINKAALKQRTFTARDGRREFTRYRLDNEETADVEATVLQMAIKRAKSSAVKSLPGLSEIFAEVGDPDEERREEDAARQESLNPIRLWLASIKQASRPKAMLAVFQQPVRTVDIPKLELEDLAIAVQRIEIGTTMGVDWASPTVNEDLLRALRTSAAKAKADLFGEEPPTQPHAGDSGPIVTPATTAGESSQGTTPATSPVDPSNPSQSAASVPEYDIAWRRTLRAHQEQITAMAQGVAYTAEQRERLETLVEQIAFALAPFSTTTDQEGFALADSVFEWMEMAKTSTKG